MSTQLPSSGPRGDVTHSSTGRPADFWPVLLCWVAVALDGFDLVVLGVVIPTLLGTGALGFTESTVTTASTLGLVGMGIGAVTIGPLTDRFGRRKSLITSVAAFSVLTIATGLAQSVGQFTTFRFLAGLGLGACLPTALAFMSEHARPGRGGHGGDPDDDRLPRRRRAHRAARAVAGRRVRLGVDVRRRRRPGPARRCR